MKFRNAHVPAYSHRKLESAMDDAKAAQEKAEALAAAEKVEVSTHLCFDKS